MILLNKQKVVVECSEDGRLRIVFGVVRERKEKIAVDLPTMKWRDKEARKKGDGMEIIRYINRLPKERRLIRTNHDGLNTCKVMLRKGALVQCRNLRNAWIIRGLRITFPKITSA